MVIPVTVNVKSRENGSVSDWRSSGALIQNIQTLFAK